jgi:hypothetical protein
VPAGRPVPRTLRDPHRSRRDPLPPTSGRRDVPADSRASSTCVDCRALEAPLAPRARGAPICASCGGLPTPHLDRRPKLPRGLVTRHRAARSRIAPASEGPSPRLGAKDEQEAGCERPSAASWTATLRHAAQIGPPWPRPHVRGGLVGMCRSQLRPPWGSQLAPGCSEAAVFRPYVRSCDGAVSGGSRKPRSDRGAQRCARLGTKWWQRWQRLADADERVKSGCSRCRNGSSRCSGIGVHDGPAHAYRVARSDVRGRSRRSVRPWFTATCTPR